MALFYLLSCRWILHLHTSVNIFKVGIRRYKNVHDHCIQINPLKKNVKCNYYGKVVSGFHRLKCHLGAIGKDVTHRSKVLVDVKEVVEPVLLEKKMKRSLSPLKVNVNSIKQTLKLIYFHWLKGLLSLGKECFLKLAPVVLKIRRRGR